MADLPKESSLNLSMDNIKCKTLKTHIKAETVKYYAFRFKKKTAEVEHRKPRVHAAMHLVIYISKCIFSYLRINAYYIST